MARNKSYTYDVAISYAGEDRAHAEALAAALERRGIAVFLTSMNRRTSGAKTSIPISQTFTKIRLAN